MSDEWRVAVHCRCLTHIHTDIRGWSGRDAWQAGSRLTGYAPIQAEAAPARESSLHQARLR